MGPQDYAAAIRAAWQGSTDRVLEACAHAAAAKAQDMGTLYAVAQELQGTIDRSTLRRLAIIGECSEFYQPGAAALLPQSWGTLYELTKLGSALAGRLGDGSITPRTTRANVAGWLKPATAAALSQPVPQAPSGNVPETLEGALGVITKLRKAGKPADYAGKFKPAELAMAIKFLEAVRDAKVAP